MSEMVTRVLFQVFLMEITPAVLRRLGAVARIAVSRPAALLEKGSARVAGRGPIGSAARAAPVAARNKERNILASPSWSDAAK